MTFLWSYYKLKIKKTKIFLELRINRFNLVQFFELIYGVPIQTFVRRMGNIGKSGDPPQAEIPALSRNCNSRF